jgi:photosystem II stability/assembly factor-like uncharacterized protein
MKIFVLFYLLSAALLFPQSSWFWQNPKPHGNSYSSMEIFNNVLIAATGYNILRSTDQGGTWFSLFESTSPLMNTFSISFIDENTGWALKESAEGRFIIKTTNGGNNWHQLSELNSIADKCKFINESTGFVFNDSIYRTTDGGLSWQNITTFQTSSISGITFVGDSTGWVLSFLEVSHWWGTEHIYTIYKTTDQGNSWTEQYQNSYIASFNFVSPDRGYLFEKDKLYSTTDGGSTWNFKADLPVSFSYGKFISSTIGILKTENQLYRTTNGGESWNLVFDSEYTIYEIYFKDSYIVVTGANGYMIYSTNSGLTWDSYYTTKVKGELRSVFFTDLQYGWAVGTNNSAVRTTNSGDTWNEVTITNIDEEFLSIWFIDRNIGFIGGANNLYKTVDQGSNWSIVLSNKVIFDVQFLDEEKGFALGYQSFFSTTDGGTSWSIKPFSSFINPKKMHFISDKKGFIAGIRQLLKTTDGGNTWENKYDPAENITFSDIYFVDSLFGWAAANGDRQFRTTDGGDTWIGQQTNHFYYPNVYFADRNYGWYTVHGSVFFSSDGGVNWINERNFTYYGLHDIHGIGETVWTVGGNGIIRNSGTIIPVEMVSFNAVAAGKDIIVSWVTATETNNMGFEVQRKTSAAEYEVLSFISGHGTSAETKSYQYIDKNIEPGSYIYRLKQIDYDGSFSYSYESEVIMNIIPGEFSLEQNYPNPFNPITRIKFSIPSPQIVLIKIYDLLGNEISELINGTLTPGIYDIEWNGKNTSSGIYYYKMAAGEYVQVRKMILLK